MAMLICIFYSFIAVVQPGGNPSNIPQVVYFTSENFFTVF